jgi:phage terminase large subunit GpA-like protein
LRLAVVIIIFSMSHVGTQCGRDRLPIGAAVIIPQAIRVSASLPDAWFEQVTAERRFIHYVRNRAGIEFRPIRSGIRNEGLDCLVYAMAARRGARIDFDERAMRDGGVALEEKKPDGPRKPSFLGGRRTGWL